MNLLSSNADVEGTAIRFGRTDNGNIRFHSILQKNGGAAANNYLDFKLHNGGSGGSYTEQVSVLKLSGDSKIYAGGDIIPSTNNTHDLGTSSLRWDNVYVNDMHFSNHPENPNSVDGTWGDWTLQEGENDIFMLNNRTGKKYKMALTEVS